MFMRSLKFATKIIIAIITAALVTSATGPGAVRAHAQTPTASDRAATQMRVSRGGPLASVAAAPSYGSSQVAPQSARAASSQGAPHDHTQGRKGGKSDDNSVADEPPPDNGDAVFEQIYENFHRTYRLGPADEIAIRVVGQPDITVERAKISPDGRVFHPLLGDVEVGGLTVEQLGRKLAKAASTVCVDNAHKS